MQRLALIEVPGLTLEMAETLAPRIKSTGKPRALKPEVPGLTLPAHATLTTGLPASEHGVIGNGWFFRDHNEVMMWRQGEGLVKGEHVWEAGRKSNPDFTCLKHFCWPGMGSTADYYVNVRPAYFADGRKSGDVYANEPGMADELTRRFGAFPLFKFWGPGTSIESSKWIADTAAWIVQEKLPTLALIYLPHLDYRQQTLGPNDPAIADDVRELDDVAGDLIEKLQALDYEVMLVSSYTMQEVSKPVHLNRKLREAGMLQVLKNPTGELIDFGMSEAFAVADHQIAQVYVKGDVAAVRSLLESTDGVAKVELGQHENEGELVVYAERDAWFTYYYWLDDADAPDFARTVAIHSKPGYDPCEMLLDPAIPIPKLKVAGKVLRKKLGFRYLMDVIPLDASLIKGSHGLAPESEAKGPVIVSSFDLPDEPQTMQGLKNLMLQVTCSNA